MRSSGLDTLLRLQFRKAFFNIQSRFFVAVSGEGDLIFVCAGTSSARAMTIENIFFLWISDVVKLQRNLGTIRH